MIDYLIHTLGNITTKKYAFSLEFFFDKWNAFPPLSASYLFKNPKSSLRVWKL
jgi:hypothetical protein